MVLFASIDDLKTAGIPVNGTSRELLNRINPYLESVWQELLPKFIGIGQVAALETALSVENPAAWVTKVRPYLRRVVGRLAYAQYLPFAEVQIADDGITVSGSNERKPAFERQVKQIRTTLLDSGWSALESLLLYMELADNAANFSEYNTFRNGTDKRLLATAVDFSSYYQIGGNRLTYNALVPTIDRLTRDVLIPQLGSKWPGILTSVDAADKKAVVQLKTWLAFRTVFEAAPLLAIDITAVGLRVHYSSHIDNVDYYTPPTEYQVNRLLERAERVSSEAWSEAVAVLEPSGESGGEGSRVIDQTDAKIFIF